MGGIPGAIVAGLLGGGLEELFLILRGVTERDIYVMLLLFLFLTFRPGGIFSRFPRTGLGTTMEFYLGLAQIIGVHTILGLSAYVILQTGQVPMAQAGLVSVGAYVAAMLTAMGGWQCSGHVDRGGGTQRGRLYCWFSGIAHQGPDVVVHHGLR
ncbi:MAG: hypothetical protein Ct9H300mP16_10530 [Pseudomonadota bacterium]|nr:MAG: hypothetical protein Ct9H300mP16_10530 [Pseudomonadota bacterium]